MMGELVRYNIFKVFILFYTSVLLSIQRKIKQIKHFLSKRIKTSVFQGARKRKRSRLQVISLQINPKQENEESPWGCHDNHG